jgi:arylsulfatase A-like enzyme
VSLHNPHDICHLFAPRNQWTSSAEPPPPHGVDDNRLPPLPPNHEADPYEPELLQQRRATLTYGGELAAASAFSEREWRTYLQTYYQLVQSVDRCVGHIRAALEEGGWAENTLIVFTSDHGEGVAAHRWVTKLSPYEESIRVPFIAVPPGHDRRTEGTIDTRHLVSGLDIFPTLLAYACVSPADRPRDLRGISLEPLLNRDHTHAPRSSLLVNLDLHPDHPDDTARIIITNDHWKYIRFSRGDRPEQLFDLADDPGETRNRIHDNIEQADRMRHIGMT